MERRVSNPRMVTANVEFRASIIGVNTATKRWRKADIDLHGYMLTLSEPQTDGPSSEKTKIETFRIEPEMVCDRRGDCKFKLNFPKKRQKVYLQFRSKLAAVAWRALLEARD